MRTEWKIIKVPGVERSTVSKKRVKLMLLRAEKIKMTSSQNKRSPTQTFVHQNCLSLRLSVTHASLKVRTRSYSNRFERLNRRSKAFAPAVKVTFETVKKRPRRQAHTLLCSSGRRRSHKKLRLRRLNKLQGKRNQLPTHQQRFIKQSMQQLAL